METAKDLKEKLENEVGITGWKALNSHFMRDALITVSNDLDIVEVGLMIAEDNSEKVQHWLADAKIGKPTEKDVETWKENSTEFTSLILSPYVLIQPLP